MTLLHSDITNKIIKSFYAVYNKLGYGFLEKVYENAMLIELHKLGLHVQSQQRIKVYYDDFQVGDYYADLVVNDVVIIEPIAGSTLIDEHEYQHINYLKATDIEVGFLLNFGETPQFKRKIFNNDKKNRDL